MNPLQFLQHVFLGDQKVSVSHRAARHIFAGGVGTLLYMATVAVLVEFGSINPVLSVVIASIMLDIYTYAISRTWVYRPMMSHAYSIPRFIFVLVLALALNTVIMHITVNVLELWYVWGLAFATVIVPTTNFLLSYYWAFR